MSSLYIFGEAASTQFRRIQFFGVRNHIHEPVQTAVVSARAIGLKVVLRVENLFASDWCWYLYAGTGKGSSLSMSYYWRTAGCMLVVE
jgi:hypothetical protein